ncbi:hypothetical protein K1T71_010192 [Dendrolimus kikuchii]|uniref:Uncharacterized protein n=1 Tax=Dendrolimus kikuchii TaxID=765133 RepID=A0ACC1CQX8_9NEOP|nr:hypothetical protein K1T71_010192 [Dendrolimus kikuchii]
MSGDEEEYEVLQWKGKPATVILINIFNAGTYDTIQKAHAVTCSMMRQYLRASSDQIVGVCLYGIEKSDSSLLETNSAVDIIPLTAPSLENFKTLKKNNFRNVTPSKELILSDVLLHCQSLFANLKTKVLSRNIIILSRLDMPPCKTDEERTLNRVGKLVDANINIKLVNISRDEYEVHSFYKDFLVEATRQKDVTIPKPLWDVKEIVSLIVQNSNRHLVDAQLKFYIGNDITIAVGVYNILKSYESTRLKKHKVDKDTNAIVKTFNQLMKVTVNQDEESDMDVEETQVPLLKDELLHSKVFADKKISFTDSEMKMIKNPFGPPMIKLLGFKPMNYMSKEKWFLRSGYFLYPNESKIEGSTVAFKAMYKACVDMDVVAICMLCKKVNSKPQLVALMPSSHPFNLDIEIGFDVIALPFKENVKDIPVPDEDSEVTSDTEHKTFLQNALTNLVFDYQPDMFENPVLQCQYRSLETKKLGDDVDPFVDSTKPNSEKYENLEDDLFYEYFGPFGPIAAKRGAGPSTTVNSKKSKMEGYSESYVQDMIQQNKVDNFTKPQLMEILKQHNVEKITSSLKKPDLVKLVYKYCSKS